MRLHVTAIKMLVSALESPNLVKLICIWNFSVKKAGILGYVQIFFYKLELKFALNIICVLADPWLATSKRVATILSRLGFFLKSFHLLCFKIMTG